MTLGTPRLAAFVAVTALLFPASSFADDYPSKPIKLLVGASAGGMRTPWTFRPGRSCAKWLIGRSTFRSRRCFPEGGVKQCC